MEAKNKITIDFDNIDYDFIKQYASEENLDVVSCCKKVLLDYIEDYYDYKTISNLPPLGTQKLTSLEDVKKELQDV